MKNEADDREQWIQEALEIVRRDLNQHLDHWSADLKEVLSHSLETQFAEHLRTIARQEALRVLEEWQRSRSESPGARRAPAGDSRSPRSDTPVPPTRSRLEDGSQVWARPAAGRAGRDRQVGYWSLQGTAGKMAVALALSAAVLIVWFLWVQNGTGGQPTEPITRNSNPPADKTSIPPLPQTTPAPITTVIDDGSAAKLLTAQLGMFEDRWLAAFQDGRFAAAARAIVQSKDASTRVGQVLSTYLKSPATLSEDDRACLKHAFVQSLLNRVDTSSSKPLTIDGDISWPDLERPLFSSAPRLKRFLNEVYLPGKGVNSKGASTPLERLAANHKPFPDLLERLMSAIVVELELHESLD